MSQGKKERRKLKRQKKRKWSSKGGYVAPIIIPSTPNGILLKMLKKVAESEPGLRFNFVEKGGTVVTRYPLK